MSHLKAFRHGKYETKGLSCGITSSICQDVLKSDNLLHKQGFVDSQMKTTVSVDFCGKESFSILELSSQLNVET